MSQPDALPAHWKTYLEAFDKFLVSDYPTEARAMRRRMDRHLAHALDRDGVGHDRPKRESSLETSEPLNLPVALAAAVGRGRRRMAA